MAKKSGGSVQRVKDALASLGLDNEVQELAASTRSAADAAVAVGCDVAQIVKSLVVRGSVSGELVLVLTSGRNRVCMEKVAALAGEPWGWPRLPWCGNVPGSPSAGSHHSGICTP